MRISSTPPSYSPSYSKAILPQAQPQHDAVVFAGSKDHDDTPKKTGTNWKAQAATLGLLTMASLMPTADATALRGNKQSQTHSLSTTTTPELPMMTFVETQMNGHAEHLNAQKKKDTKELDAKTLQAKHEKEQAENKKAEAKFFAQKHALDKRDDNSDKVCRAPAGGPHGGAVIITNWWSTTSVAG